MVSLKSVEQQLKSIKFNSKGWGKGEVKELPGVLMDEEQIFECVNGTYEGGFALLVGTNLRMLLIDSKPLKFLTVEDLRFDMINQIDYSHRLFGARINVSAGNKNLKFTSYNQKRLRKLINHIQHRMAEVKKEQTSSAETQQQHLEKINQQLQTYLLAQHEQQLKLSKQLEEAQGRSVAELAKLAEPVRPAPELADFLYAQSLLQRHDISALAPQSQKLPEIPPVVVSNIVEQQPQPSAISAAVQNKPSPFNAALDVDSLVEEGRKEVFGKRLHVEAKPLQNAISYLGTEINPMRIAYAKLPMALRNRKFRYGAFANPRSNSAGVQLPSAGTNPIASV